MHSSELAGILGPTLLLFLIFLLILLLILWTLLPFAVFGVKKRLDLMIDELRMIKATLNSRGVTSDRQQSLDTPQPVAVFSASDRNECANEIIKGLRYRYLPEFIRQRLKNDYKCPDALIVEVTNKLQQEGKLSREMADAICATDK